MATQFDRIKNVSYNRESIRLKVRVARLWSVPMFNNADQISSLDMILVDEDGGKIQATVRKSLLYKFCPVLEEGFVFKMVYFNVVPNTGHYRATHHDFKLVFMFKTSVVKHDSVSIPLLGLTLLPFNEIFQLDDTYEYLIDVIGVLTAVFPGRQYEKEGKVTKMVVIELTDSHGKLECTLFGEHVEELRRFLLLGGHVQVIVVLQLARVKTFRGKIVIQNSMNATKLHFNPDIPEAISFRNSIAEHGVLDVEPLAVVLDNSREGMEADFMRIHARKSVVELDDLKENGLFVVLGEIMEILDDSSWYYLACKCNRAVSLRDNLYFCATCDVPVFNVSPRFKVKVVVADSTGTAVFVLFDRDDALLLKHTCEELLTHSFEEVAEKGYPKVLERLIGKRILFKVEAKMMQSTHFDGSFPVRRVCPDESIIAMFELPEGEITPPKAMFTPTFTEIATEIIDLTEPETQVGSELVPTVSLGNDDFGFGTNYTPAKRCLDADFEACQMECLSSKMRSASSSNVKNDSIGKDEEEVEAIFALVPVKLEKD